MSDHTFWERKVPGSCREMQCVPCGVENAMHYTAQWHSRLPKTNRFNMTSGKYRAYYAAVYELNFFAVAIWTTPVAANRMKDGELMMELRRLAIADDAPKYTATWMLARMIRDIRKTYPELIKLVSYQDTEVHTGTIYAAGNWKLERTTEYTAWNTSSRVRTAKVQSTAAKNRWAYELK